jgi:uncharacterized Fe-S cluster protein YjdI/CDGSH-type Zn-finger protein
MFEATSGDTVGADEVAAMRKVYLGEGIEVSFDLDRCIHVGECLLTLPEVFDLKRRPWVDADGADADVVADTILRCPSGALQFRRLAGGPEEAHATTTVEPMRNGPLRVTGDIHVRLEDGTEETLPRATLCRCGGSARKPFCDNTHLPNGFRAPGEPFRIRLSSVRPRITQPIAPATDPRGVDAPQSAGPGCRPGVPAGIQGRAQGADRCQSGWPVPAHSVGVTCPVSGSAR